ncbi:MAG: BatA and WFA domain-containing protein, partial [Myxococcota bacterium]
MTLLAPLLLLGLGGLALPIAAHLLGREPPQRIDFAAMRFLSETDQSVTHRRAVQDLPLLIVRLLALALIIVALTRPSSTERSAVAVVGEPHDAVILVDGSRSMGLTVGGQRLLDLAATRIAALLSSLPPGSRVGLATSDPDGPLLELSADPDRVREAIEAWQASGAPRPGAWTLTDAVPIATSLLADSDRRRPRVIYAVGDETAGGLGSLPAAAEGGVLVLPIPAADLAEIAEGPIEHVSIESVDWAPAPDLDPRAIRIEAEIARHGPVIVTDDDDTPPPPEVRTVGVALRIADAEVARTTVELATDGVAPVEFTPTLLDETGAVAASVVLVD